MVPGSGVCEGGGGSPSRWMCLLGVRAHVSVWQVVCSGRRRRFICSFITRRCWSPCTRLQSERHLDQRLTSEMSRWPIDLFTHAEWAPVCVSVPSHPRRLHSSLNNSLDCILHISCLISYFFAHLRRSRWICSGNLLRRLFLPRFGRAGTRLHKNTRPLRHRSSSFVRFVVNGKRCLPQSVLKTCLYEVIKEHTDGPITAQYWSVASSNKQRSRLPITQPITDAVRAAVHWQRLKKLIVIILFWGRGDDGIQPVARNKVKTCRREQT